jgi:hypothetical protein
MVITYTEVIATDPIRSEKSRMMKEPSSWTTKRREKPGLSTREADSCLNQYQGGRVGVDERATVLQNQSRILHVDTGDR